MQFNKLNDNSRAIINNILRECDYLGAEYLQSYQRAWFSRDEELCCAIEDNIVYLAFCASHIEKLRNKELFLPPLTTMDRLPLAYSRLEEYCQENNMEFAGIKASREYVNALGERYHYMMRTHDSEYIYLAESLINLPGKKYHAKRNHIAKFARLYDYEFREYVDSDLDSIMNLYDSWSQLKDIDNNDREEYALKHMLDNWRRYGLKIGVLLVSNKIIAFSCGEVSPSNVGIVHFEKADIAYDGAYPMINNLMASKYFSNVVYINRQEDMGIDGLRKAKRSYYPVKMLEKWKIMPRNKTKTM